ncbi:MFS transporter [Rathayibacter soli]|uniref:MFS transporter n=1 Tax=Rathayibacter soli TaxID=3144168 RepID=UPI0027E3E537|nr:MFS transporter [Glaciibacter superstes]
MPALLGATALGFSGYAVLITVAPLWAVTGGSGPVGAGLINGALMLFTVLAQAFVPMALRLFGWGPTLAVGLLLLGGASLPQLLSNQLGVLLTLAAVRGVGFGVLTVVGSAAVAELVEPSRRGRAIGAYGLAIAAPQLFLLPFAPWMAQNIGFPLVFAIGSCPLVGIPAAFVLARRLREKHAEYNARRDGAPAPGDSDTAGGRAAVIARLLRPVILLLGVTLAGGAMLTFAPQMSSNQTATVIGLFLLTAVTALCRWRFGAFADRYGARRFLWPLVLVTTVALALIAWAVIDPTSTRIVPFLAGLALLGVSYGGLQNLTLVDAFSSVRRQHYSLASAVWNTGFDAGTGIGSVLLGVLAGALSFPSALLICAAISLATLPLALVRQRALAPTRPRRG